MKHRHVRVAQRQSQLHLQQTRSHWVFSLFSFCHCLVSTCSIIVTLISSVSPSDLNYPFLAQPVSFYPLLTRCM